MISKAEKLFLHLGLAKTGTSSLQAFLYSNRHTLIEKYGILYFDFQENHNFFQVMFSDKPESLLQMQMLGIYTREAADLYIDKCRHNIITEIQNHRPRVIVVSSEFFSGMSMIELSRMWKFLKDIAQEVHPIAYVRDPWSFSYSLTQELIRSGALSGEVALGYASSNVEIIRKFEDAFQAKIIVAPYINFGQSFNVVDDFSQRIGLDNFDSFTQPASTYAVNPRMTREAATMLLYLNRKYPTFDKDGLYIANPARDWMVEAIQQVKEKVVNYQLSKATAEKIYSESRADIQFMEATYFGGEKVFTELYSALNFPDYDDSLTLSCFSPVHIVEFMLEFSYILSKRAIFYHEQMLVNSTERALWQGKFHSRFGNHQNARCYFDEVLKFNNDHSEALAEIALLNSSHLVYEELSIQMQKVVVVGASGYIGRALYKAAMKSFDVVGTSCSGSHGMVVFDFSKPDDFDYGLLQHGVVVFITAAISSPDICAREHDRAWAVNVTGTSIFIQRIIDCGARVVFFSTDAIYGEREDEFDEDSECNPVGEYAQMKRFIEKRFSDNPSFKTIRLSYVFSREDKFSRYLADCAESNREAVLFHPFFRAIVHRDDVVEGALALAVHWDEVPERVINFGGPQVLSRVDFAECLREVCLSHLRFKVSEPGADFFTNRPRRIAMRSSVFSRILGRKPRSLRDAAYLEFL